MDSLAPILALRLGAFGIYKELSVSYASALLLLRCVRHQLSGWSLWEVKDIGGNVARTGAVEMGLQQFVERGMWSHGWTGAV